MQYDFCKFRAGSTEGSPAELFFYGDIVSDSWSSWAEEDQYPMNVRQLLKEIDGSDLDIHINSCGGDVFAGFAICNMLRSLSGRKRVYVDGIAASIASVIAMAGDEIIMPENAYLMIHNAWSYAQGNAEDLRKVADTLDKIDSGIVATYMLHTADDITEKKIKSMMADETWLSGLDAEKIFSNVVKTEPAQAAASVSGRFSGRYHNIPKQLAFHTENQIPKPPQADVPKDMEKYAKYLDTMRAAYGNE